MEAINIIPVRLANQEPTEIFDGENILELHENHLEYKLHFLAKEPIDGNDKSLGYEDNVLNYFITIAHKKSIVGLEVTTVFHGKRWGVYIICCGFASDIKIFFRSKSAAHELLDKLKTWWLI